MLRLLPLGLLWLASTAHAIDAADAVLGRWAGSSSIIEIARTADGGLSATVIALRHPLFRSGEAGPEGTPVTDLNNPDEALRQRPVLGLNLLGGYRFSGKRWQGEIYDPESGKTYSSRMTVSGDELKLRGYIGTPLLGRTARFVPVSRCTEKTVHMLRRSGLQGCGPS
jgi:uncharacterized protein (DUF2147 family)